MTKPLLVAGLLAMALVVEPASAQQTQPPQTQPTPPQQEAAKALIGLPVFSSDGQKLGEVIEVGMVPGGQQAIRAEMGQFLGIGSTPVVIGSDMFQKKADRIELAMTGDEVRKTITKQRQMRDKR